MSFEVINKFDTQGFVSPDIYKGDGIKEIISIDFLKEWISYREKNER